MAIPSFNSKIRKIEGIHFPVNKHRSMHSYGRLATSAAVILSVPRIVMLSHLWYNKTKQNGQMNPATYSSSLSDQNLEEDLERGLWTDEKLWFHFLCCGSRLSLEQWHFTRKTLLYNIYCLFKHLLFLNNFDILILFHWSKIISIIFSSISQYATTRANLP